MAFSMVLLTPGKAGATIDKVARLLAALGGGWVEGGRRSNVTAPDTLTCRLRKRGTTTDMSVSGILVSFIIPVRDARVRLERLLDCLNAHVGAAVPCEIIVADDGSREDLTACAAAYGARCLRSTRSRGPAAARNAAAATARGEVLFFLDADVEYAPGMAEKALALMNADPVLQAVSFFSQPYSAGDNPIRNFGAAIEHYWFSGLLPPGVDSGRHSGFTTRNGAVRRAAFIAVNGFDPGYATNAHEDYDFGKRLSAHCRCAITRTPYAYHAFPESVLRLMRNYYLRTALFVPYYLKRRPPLDATQVSRREALLRLWGGTGCILLLACLLPFPGRALPAAAGLTMVAVYGCCLRRFLRQAWSWSDGNGAFLLWCFSVHLLSSPVIMAGGVHGLWVAASTAFRPRNSAEPRR